MTLQLKTKIMIDIAMTVTLLLLMGYMLTGDFAHEIIGAVMILLWIGHIVLNRTWYGSVGKGRYPLHRIIDTVVNILLLVSVIGLIVSSVILSAYVFRFLGIEGGLSYARLVHMVSAYWCFVLSSFHLGLHWSRMLKRFGHTSGMKPSVIRTVVLHLLAVSLSGFGVYAFIKHQIASYMFMRTYFVFFDFEQSPFAFFFEYICMMVLFASVSYYISLLSKKFRVLSPMEPALSKGE